MEKRKTGKRSKRDKRRKSKWLNEFLEIKKGQTEKDDDRIKCHILDQCPSRLTCCYVILDPLFNSYKEVVNHKDSFHK